MFREGEIIWCRFGINIGNENIGKGKYYRRPVLVLRKFTQDVFLGIPLTRKEKKGDWYHEIVHGDLKNFLILNQAKTLDRKRLENKMYEISEKELHIVKILYCNLILKNTKTRI